VRAKLGANGEQRLIIASARAQQLIALARAK
jgi:hypothetical protein